MDGVLKLRTSKALSRCRGRDRLCMTTFLPLSAIAVSHIAFDIILTEIKEKNDMLHSFITAFKVQKSAEGEQTSISSESQDLSGKVELDTCSNSEIGQYIHSIAETIEEASLHTDGYTAGMDISRDRKTSLHINTQLEIAQVLNDPQPPEPQKSFEQSKHGTSPEVKGSLLPTIGLSQKVRMAQTSKRSAKRLSMLKNLISAGKKSRRTLAINTALLPLTEEQDTDEEPVRSPLHRTHAATEREPTKAMDRVSRKIVLS